MRIVVVGAGGQLGRELGRVLPAASTTLLARTDLDVRDAGAVRARVISLAPDVVVNAAADNRVDALEDDPETADAVNARGVAHLADACREAAAWLVHTSTDYVFDGRSARPYAEDETPNPAGVYARSKLAGERFARALPTHAVVRLAGLYARGGSRAKGGSFVDRILARARAGERLRVVADQVTSPTWAADAATTLAALLPHLLAGRAPAGIYHLTNTGACSWHEFACAALALAGVRAEVEPITTAAYGARAPRPRYSALAGFRLAAAGVPPLRPWREALAAYLADR